MADTFWWVALITGMLIVVGMLSGGRGDRGSTPGGRRLAALRRSWRDYAEISERRALLNRPWEEEFVHWAFDGQQWHLHGHLIAPGGRARSTTSSGWCPGLRSTTPGRVV
jgi:hypothetical protein